MLVVQRALFVVQRAQFVVQRAQSTEASSDRVWVFSIAVFQTVNEQHPWVMRICDDGTYSRAVGLVAVGIVQNSHGVVGQIDRFDASGFRDIWIGIAGIVDQVRSIVTLGLAMV